MSTIKTSEVDKEKVISLMTDNWVSEKIDYSRNFGRTLLSVKNVVSADGIVKNAGFEVHAGEILGVFGLAGSGRTELLECIYGCRQKTGGTVELDGKVIEIITGKSIRNGMVLVKTEEERLWFVH